MFRVPDPPPGTQHGAELGAADSRSELSPSSFCYDSGGLQATQLPWTQKSVRETVLSAGARSLESCLRLEALSASRRIGGSRNLDVTALAAVDVVMLLTLALASRATRMPSPIMTEPSWQNPCPKLPEPIVSADRDTVTLGMG